MDNTAWFTELLAEKRPAGRWSSETACLVRTCIGLYRQTGRELLKQYVLEWADSLIAQDGCVPACWQALFFALDETGEDKYRAAIIGMMEGLGREPAERIDSAEMLLAVEPFRMAYEMKLGGMEKVGLVTAKYRAAHKLLWDADAGLCGGDLRSTALALLAVSDAAATCADQLYEHWRALVDIYRELLRGALAVENAQGETAAMLVHALYAGVRMNLIDPERYLPLAAKRIRAMKSAGMEQAAAMLEMEGGAL